MSSLSGPRSVLWLGGIYDYSSLSLHCLPKSCLSKMTQELPPFSCHSSHSVSHQGPPGPQSLPRMFMSHKASQG